MGLGCRSRTRHRIFVNPLPRSWDHFPETGRRRKLISRIELDSGIKSPLPIRINTIIKARVSLATTIQAR